MQYNRDLTPEETRQKKTLSGADRAEVRAAMKSVADGEQANDPPAPAPGPAGVRWADVPLAVGQACGEAGVELIVLRTTEVPGDRYTFELRSIEDWPGELVVERVDGPQLYEARCTLGRFPDDPVKIERCRKLIDTFEDKLKALGRQRWFNDE